MLTTKSKIDKLQNALDKAQTNDNNYLEKIPLALKELVEDNDTYYTFSKKINVTRESLYKILSEKGNPRLSTLLTIMKALDLGIKVIKNPRK